MYFSYNPTCKDELEINQVSVPPTISTYYGANFNLLQMLDHYYKSLSKIYNRVSKGPSTFLSMVHHQTSNDILYTTTD